MTIQQERMQFAMAAEAVNAGLSEQLVEQLNSAAGETVEEQLARKEAHEHGETGETMQVAQVDAAAVDDVATAGAVMSDLGEAGLIGDDATAVWEAQDIAFVGEAGSLGVVPFFGTGNGAAVVGATIGAAGKIQQNSQNNTDDTQAPGPDTSVVIFDLVHGVSSSHSDRTFDPDVHYSIYVIMDADDGVLNTDANTGPGSWGAWANAGALGSDDMVHLIGMNNSGDLSLIDAWPASVGAIASLSANTHAASRRVSLPTYELGDIEYVYVSGNGMVARGASDIFTYPVMVITSKGGFPQVNWYTTTATRTFSHHSARIWSGTAHSLAGDYGVATLPAGMLTSQGLA